jgi:hypothetical protein
VGDKAATQPAKDLTKHRRRGGETPEERARSAKGKGAAGDLTARLLKANQRAQEEMKKERMASKEPRAFSPRGPRGPVNTRCANRFTPTPKHDERTGDVPRRTDAARAQSPRLIGE